MSYAQFGLIQASDYNTFVGGNPTTTTNTLNAVWAVGGAGAGYGQTAAANVSAGQTVAASNWATLVSNTASAASHQGSSITSVTAPVAGGQVTYLSAIPTNLTTIYTNRGNAAAQGSTSANTVTRGTTWSDSVTFTHTVTFANGDAARYFFNAGGQIKMTASHSNTTAGVNDALATLCTATGTVVMSGQNSGTRTIAATSYSGITKIGGSGSTEVLSTNSGYFGLSTANTTVFDQNSGTAPYTALMDLRYIAKTNGVQGSNSDNGSVVTIYTLISETGANGTIGTGTTVTCTLTPPATTFIANSWGTITLAGSVVVA